MANHNIAQSLPPAEVRKQRILKKNILKGMGISRDPKDPLRRSFDTSNGCDGFVTNPLRAVFVKGLNNVCVDHEQRTRAELVELFSQAGDVVQVQLPSHGAYLKDFAFIHFASRNHAIKAVEMGTVQTSDGTLLTIRKMNTLAGVKRVYEDRKMTADEEQAGRTEVLHATDTHKSLQEHSVQQHDRACSSRSNPALPDAGQEEGARSAAAEEGSGWQTTSFEGKDAVGKPSHSQVSAVDLGKAPHLADRKRTARPAGPSSEGAFKSSDDRQIRNERPPRAELCLRSNPNPVTVKQASVEEHSTTARGVQVTLASLVGASAQEETSADRTLREELAALQSQIALQEAKHAQEIQRLSKELGAEQASALPRQQALKELEERLGKHITLGRHKDRELEELRDALQRLEAERPTGSELEEEMLALTLAREEEAARARRAEQCVETMRRQLDEAASQRQLDE
eukprot:gene2635-3400_t